MVQNIFKLNKNTAKIVFFLGLAGVLIPHGGFLLNIDLFSNLNVVSHSFAEIVSAGAIYVGYINK